MKMTNSYQDNPLHYADKNLSRALAFVDAALKRSIDATFLPAPELLRDAMEEIQETRHILQAVSQEEEYSDA